MSVPQANLPEQLAERPFQDWVVNLARTRKWTLRYHTHDSRRSEPGFPDWVFVHERVGSIVFAELKGWNTPIEPEQQRWIDALAAMGLPAFIWRPKDAQAVLDTLWYPPPIHVEIR